MHHVHHNVWYAIPRYSCRDFAHPLVFDLFCVARDGGGVQGVSVVGVTQIDRVVEVVEQALAGLSLIHI